MVGSASSPHRSGRASPVFSEVPVPKGRPEEDPCDENYALHRDQHNRAVGSTSGDASSMLSQQQPPLHRDTPPRLSGGETNYNFWDQTTTPDQSSRMVFSSAFESGGRKLSNSSVGREHALESSQHQRHPHQSVVGGLAGAVEQGGSSSSNLVNLVDPPPGGVGVPPRKLERRGSEVRLDDEVLNSKLLNVIAEKQGGKALAPPAGLTQGHQGYNQQRDEGLQPTGLQPPAEQQHSNPSGVVRTNASTLLPAGVGRRKQWSTLNLDEDQTEITSFLLEAAQLREKYTPCGDHAQLWADWKSTRVEGGCCPADVSERKKFSFSMPASGVVEVYEVGNNSVSDTLTSEEQRNNNKVNLFPQPTLDEYYRDMERLFQIRTCGPVVSHCFYRLKMLRAKFELYVMDYGEEQEQQKNTHHRDFYNVRKVDNHIHHAAAMNVKHLTRFMKKKFKKCVDDIVGEQVEYVLVEEDTEENEEPSSSKQSCHTVSKKVKKTQQISLGDLARELNINWSSLTINSLQMWTDRSCMHRFDRFNSKYSPLGQAKLRTLFLKTDNIMNGQYFAEITRELLDDLEETKYQHTEWRLSIYGRKMDEWDKLAKWVLAAGESGLAKSRHPAVTSENKKLISANNMWMIQIPRLFETYKSAGQLDNFQQMLDNIFVPLFEVTIDPASHPELDEFLKHIGGFDTVDDESKSASAMERHFSSKSRAPKDWDVAPSYKYYSFYIQTNMRVLNKLRAKLRLNQFKFRPHAGEAGEVHHLDTAFLLADGINHGINLKKNPALQYLFYLCQIGLSMSPCSNNQLFLSYEKNPFYQFFQTGLNVTLSTDDPLMFHQTKEPLLEEYAIAKQLWKLSPSDLCEIARNSVLQCSYPMHTVLMWLGLEHPSQLHTENSIYHTNVPDSRFKFRRRSLREEWASLHGQEGWDYASDWEDSYQLLLLSPKARQASMDTMAHRAGVTPGVGAGTESRFQHLGGTSGNNNSFSEAAGAGANPVSHTNSGSKSTGNGAELPPFQLAGRVVEATPSGGPLGNAIPTGNSSSSEGGAALGADGTGGAVQLTDGGAMQTAKHAGDLGGTTLFPAAALGLQSNSSSHQFPSIHHFAGDGNDGANLQHELPLPRNAVEAMEKMQYDLGLANRHGEVDIAHEHGAIYAFDEAIYEEDVVEEGNFEEDVVLAPPPQSGMHVNLQSYGQFGLDGVEGGTEGDVLAGGASSHSHGRNEQPLLTPSSSKGGLVDSEHMRIPQQLGFSFPLRTSEGMVGNGQHDAADEGLALGFSFAWVKNLATVAAQRVLGSSSFSLSSTSKVPPPQPPIGTGNRRMSSHSVSHTLDYRADHVHRSGSRMAASPGTTGLYPQSASGTNNSRVAETERQRSSEQVRMASLCLATGVVLGFLLAGGKGNARR